MTNTAYLGTGVYRGYMGMVGCASFGVTEDSPLFKSFFKENRVGGGVDFGFVVVVMGMGALRKLMNALFHEE